MTFSKRLRLDDLGTTDSGRPLFKLAEPFTFSKNDGEPLGLHVCVPNGFVTDFASVPRIFWRIFPPSGQYNRAAVVHDYLCFTKGCSRFMADAVFREAMRELGVPRWKRIMMYLACRAYSIFRGLR